VTENAAGFFDLFIILFFVWIILKRNILFIMMILGFAVMVQAQVWGPGWNRRNIPAREAVTVSGTMVVARRMPVLKSGEVTYYVGGLSRLIGFIDGLKEGAQVTIEGAAITIHGDKNVKFLIPSKLTINGKVYDLAPPEREPNTAPRQWQGGNRFQEYRRQGPMKHPGPRAPAPQRKGQT
jgi:hypothetical protein